MVVHPLVHMECPGGWRLEGRLMASAGSDDPQCHPAEVPVYGFLARSAGL
jgi:hypothetical protein